MKTSVMEKFLSYVVHNTRSQDDAGVIPSTPCQLAFAKVLVEECKSIGLSEVTVDEHGIVMATLPPNADTPEVIGFLAHMDTSPDFSGEDVSPQVVYNYNGGKIILNDRLTLTPAEFPDLKNYVGQTLITTDGNTLLGADDKAGIAEILAAMEYLIQHPEIPHGKIRVAFTPDEEVGAGTDAFDVAAFGADYAYTIDGGRIGEFECENFNAARAVIEVVGKSVHPGYAKGIMKNAGLIAAGIVSVLPTDETPATTEGRQGYYHMSAMTASVEYAKIDCRIRDFDAEKFEYRKGFMEGVADAFNLLYGDGTVNISITDEYRDMKAKLDEHPHVAARAKRAFDEAGLAVLETPIRGGTDGAKLTFKGLPCPNIFTGGHNFHGPYEYIPVESMEKAVEIILNICKLS